MATETSWKRHRKFPRKLYRLTGCYYMFVWNLQTFRKNVLIFSSGWKGRSVYGASTFNSKSWYPSEWPTNSKAYNLSICKRDIFIAFLQSDVRKSVQFACALSVRYPSGLFCNNPPLDIALTCSSISWYLVSSQHEASLHWNSVSQTGFRTGMSGFPRKENMWWPKSFNGVHKIFKY